ncbi:hypothetical protein DVP60_08740 [Yersinia enterocolitica]|nr:hypothetical protein [Yersinia enterocolitica]
MRLYLSVINTIKEKNSGWLFYNVRNIPTKRKSTKEYQCKYILKKEFIKFKNHFKSQSYDFLFTLLNIRMLDIINN